MLLNLLRASSPGEGGILLAGIISFLVAVLIAIDVHEFAHAWMANALGDSTARELGRLTLNPLVHLDMLGTLMLLVAGFGWGKPVPVNPYQLRGNPNVARVKVSLAGPLANLITAAVLSLPLRLGNANPLLPYLTQPFHLIIGVNVLLAVFNLLPLPPLDGFNVLMGILPARWTARLAPFLAYGPMLLLLLILFGRRQNFDLLGSLINPFIRFFFRLFIGA